MRNQIDEVLKKSDDISKWISDFLDSDAPQFKGKSKEKRMQMAKAAYYAAQKNEEMKCWDGYRKQGTKIGKSGKVVNNCVKEEELEEGSESWESGYKRRVVKTSKPEHKEKGHNWRIKGKDRPEISIKLYKDKPSFAEFKKQMKRVAGHEFGEQLEESTEALKKKAEKSGVSLSILKKVYARGVAAWNSGHRPGTTPQQWGMARVNSYITKGKGTYHGADKDLRESKTIKVDHTAIMDQKNASYILVQDRKCIAKGTKEEMLKLHEETPESRVWVSTANINDLVEEKDHPYHKGLSKSTIAKRKAHWKKKDKLSDKDPAAYEPAPGDANAKTKESKHTKKYKELYGEMKKINEIGDTAKGQKALKSYSDKAFKSQDKAEAEYDHDHFDSGHHNAKAAHTITKREIGRERAAQRMKKEAVNPEAAAKASKKAQMVAKHADEREALAKKQAREKESMKEGYDHEERIARDTVKNPSKGLLGGPSASEAERILRSKYKYDDKRIAKLKESSAAKIVKTKLSTMANKNVRIPSPAERRAEIEKRKQMKEDIDMLSFDEYLQEDMRIAKASSFAKQHAGDMKTAVKKIEAIRKGLTNHPKVKDALKKANEELSDKQKKLDHNKNGKIDGADLATLRSKKKTVSELDKSTLKSYADKAHQAAQDHAYDAEHQYNDKKEQEKSRKMAAKRAAGVAKADAKLKEEENLDELSKKTLGSYVKKASFNAAQSAYQAGGSNGNIAKLQPHMDKLNKRTAGVNKATDKLAKEEVEIEETILEYDLEKNAKRYLSHKAKADKASHEAKHGMMTSADDYRKKHEAAAKAHLKARSSGMHAPISNATIDAHHKAAQYHAKKAKEGILKKEETLELKSYKDFMSEMDNSKRYVHKGTRYGGSAQRDTDHENDFGHDDEKEKFKRLLQKKPEKKTAPAPAVKRGRGRPAGSKSGARDYYNKK